MSGRTGRRSNLNHHTIDNVILAKIDEHMEESEVKLNESTKRAKSKGRNIEGGRRWFTGLEIVL